MSLKNNFGCGISSIMSDRYVKSDETEKILNIHASNLYGYALSEYLPDDEIEMWQGHAE